MSTQRGGNRKEYKSQETTAPYTNTETTEEEEKEEEKELAEKNDLTKKEIIYITK